MTAVFGIRRTVLGLLACFVISATSWASDGRWADDGWTEDAAAAVKKAAADSKDMLLLFTGSDWCPPCKRLEEEVFSKAEFGPEANKTFVLVKFDFPQTRELPPELAKQNEEWQTKYGVSGFPTVILVDKDQLPFGVLGFEEGGPENYLKRLEDFRQKRIRRDEAFAKAAQAEGAEKAKLLDEGLAQLDEGLARVYYESKLEDIGKLDADDALGLRTKWFAAEEAEKQKLIITDILTISRLEKPDRAASCSGGKLRNGPPLAVRITRSISSRRPARAACQTALCSLSTGTIFEPLLAASGSSNCPATTRDSLFARAIVFPADTAAWVLASPAQPTMAARTMSTSG